MKTIITKELRKTIYGETNIDIEDVEYKINKGVTFESPSCIFGSNFHFPFKIGAFSNINPGGFIQNVTIGRYCAIARGVKIGNGNHPTHWLSVHACQYIGNYKKYNNLFENGIITKPFSPYTHSTIGNDVWLGANVFVKDGVTIGDGAIVGANSVVTKDIPPYAIYGGVPAKLIRYRFSEDIIKQLLELKWWEYNITEFGSIDFDDIEKAIEQLKIKLPNLQKYKPKVIDYNYFVKFIQKYETKKAKTNRLIGKIKAWRKKIFG